MMADLKKCKNCGEIFASLSREVCPDCYHIEEQAFQHIYRFLKHCKNREATMMEIVEATGIKEELIMKFLKENRLHTSVFRNLAYPCNRCGARITNGNWCKRCVSELKTCWNLEDGAVNNEKHPIKGVFYSKDIK